MGRRNWNASRNRDRMRRQGTEGASNHTPMMAPLLRARKKRPQLSKTELRAQGARAWAEWQARQHGGTPK
jgi:hypothetical protein